jgi:hypothetical protein
MNFCPPASPAKQGLGWAGFKNPFADFSQNEFGFRPANTTIVSESLF